MKNFRNNILIPTRRFLVISLIFAFITVQVHAQEPERPSSGAMMIDVPVRILSLGLSVVSTAFFIVALPFTLSSGSTGDAWELVGLGIRMVCDRSGDRRLLDTIVAISCWVEWGK